MLFLGDMPFFVLTWCCCRLFHRYISRKQLMLRLAHGVSFYPAAMLIVGDNLCLLLRPSYPEDSFEREEPVRSKRDIEYRGGMRRDRKDGPKPGPMSFKEYMMNEVDDDCDPEEAKKRCWLLCFVACSAHHGYFIPLAGSFL